MDDREAFLLFAYGTLQLEEVQLATFGRRLDGRPDALRGFALSPVRVTDPHVVAVSGLDLHSIARPSEAAADRIAGTVYRLSAAELAAADRYEVGDYRRIAARLESGAEAFVYVAADGAGG